MHTIQYTTLFLQLGSVIRDICNFGFGDLYDIWHSDCWFANKFNIEVDANAIICHVKHLMEMNKY